VISEVVMPQMGADMTEGTILRWLKQEGEQVTRGEVIAEIETDKANVEIEAFDAGVFRATLAHEGDVVQVGDVIAVIAGADDDISKYLRKNGAAPGGAQATSSAQPRARTDGTQAQAPLPAKREAPTEEAQVSLPAQREAPSDGARSPAPAQPTDETRVRASPLARKIAQERGVDLTRVQGSGPGGRIVRKDVETAVLRPAAPAPPSRRPQPPAPAVADTIVKPSKMREAIARRMAHSKREAPHYYLLVDVDMTEAAAFRKGVNEAARESSGHVSINDLIVRACVLALKEHPEFNATIEGEQVTQHAEQHVCIGVALDDGLIAPAIVGAGQMSLLELAAAAKNLIERAKNGTLRAEEMTAGTFTVSNLGAFGVETLVAIIQPPQTAILGVGSVEERPVVRDGAVAIRQVMKVALSADHRVTDGALGARFLAEIKRLLERPLLLVL
jgi:pyruvate dehydrogenase E2 component (dihydrolipoamide acetyltransferase)